MKRVRFIAALSTILVLCVHSARAAASVVLSGVATGLTGPNNDQIDQWRTNTVVKTMDPDSDNIYGTAGYVMYATDAVVNSNGGVVIPADPLNYASGTQATLKSIPSFLTLANTTQNQIATSFGYKLMDDPTQPVGAAVSDVESGAALTFAALGSEFSLLSITIGPGFPVAGMRIGVLFGNADDFSGTLRLAQTANGTSSATFNQTVPPADVELGLAFFDITNANEGDAFQLFIRKDNPQPPGGNQNANVIYGGVTFDVIPEPGCVSLFLAGATIFLRRRTRARE